MALQSLGQLLLEVAGGIKEDTDDAQGGEDNAHASAGEEAEDEETEDEEAENEEAENEEAEHEEADDGKNDTPDMD